VERQEIKSIELVNIQKHKHITLSLSGINVLVGETESGKTSILRGILWNILNNTSGEKLLNNDGAKACSVTITCGDDVVSRNWSKTENTYTLNGKKFSAIRTSVPDEVSKLYAVDSVNIQRRRDVPFMVYYKDTECAKQFGDMLDVSEIDRTIGASNAHVRELKTECDALSAAVSSGEKELEELSFVDEAAESFSAIKELVLAADSEERKQERLGVLSDKLTQAAEYTNKYIALGDALKQFTALDKFSEDTTHIQDKLEAYTLLHTSLLSAAKSLDKYSKYLEASRTLTHLNDDASALREISIQGRKLSDLRKEFASLDCSKFENLDEAVKQLNQITNSAEEIGAIENKVHSLFLLSTDYVQAQTDKTKKEDRYSALQRKFKSEMPKVCPLCNQPIEVHE
jgi:DNA repair exonuclease SbcCD ATPase subunit